MLNGALSPLTVLTETAACVAIENAPVQDDRQQRVRGCLSSFVCLREQKSQNHRGEVSTPLGLLLPSLDGVVDARCDRLLVTEVDRCGVPTTSEEVTDGREVLADGP